MRRRDLTAPSGSVEPAAAWFARSSSRWQDWDIDRLIRAKAGTRVSVVIPARSEESTIGAVVSVIREQLVERTGLVDELIVIDSDSEDATSQVAAAAGARVHAASSIRPDLGSFRGKGEALWKSQFVTTGDLLVFIDADLTEWGPHFVVGLLGPLLTDPAVRLVKGFYDRVLDDGSQQVRPQGGRVTELVARPLLNLHWPELAQVVQPLAGEWAIRRSTFAELSVPVGYGVELASLIDVYRDAGLDAIAQVDLGERAHSHQSVHDLGVMAAELLIVAERRAATSAPPPESDELWQFNRGREPAWVARSVPLAQRPPKVSVGPLGG